MVKSIDVSLLDVNTLFLTYLSDGMITGGTRVKIKVGSHEG